MTNVYRELVAHFKGQAKAAAELGVSQATVSGWCRSRHGMAASTALIAEQKTGGAFPKERLCPGFPWPDQSPTVSHTLSVAPTVEQCANSAGNTSSIGGAQ